jgi:hypothetical protein
LVGWVALLSILVAKSMPVGTQSRFTTPRACFS